jgi:hypothetical protein
MKRSMIVMGRGAFRRVPHSLGPQKSARLLGRYWLNVEHE